MQNGDYIKTVRGMDSLAKRLMPFQVTDPSRPDFGGWFGDEYGFASPCHIGTARFIFILGCCLFCEDSEFYGDKDIYGRIMQAVEFEKKCLRPSGLIDIPFTNFDSPPDTAFSLSMICCAAYMAKKSTLEYKDGFLGALQPYIQANVGAIIKDGFHTPNHRWVITSALLQAQELFDVPDVTAKVTAYLNEGIDINADGFYSERSTGGYNAVVNRQLTYISEIAGRTDIFDNIVSNLKNMLYLIHHDGSVVTSISLRQDKGKRKYPDNCLDSFYYAAMRSGDKNLAAEARELLDRGVFSEYMLYMFSRHEDWKHTALPQGEPIGDYSIFMKNSGVFRIRRGKLSLTASLETSGAVSVNYGSVELTEMRIFSPYFAGAKFVAKTMEEISGGVRIRYESEFLLPQLPGYWLPTNSPFPFEELPYHTLEKRGLLPRPKLYYTLDLVENNGSIDFTIRSEGGMDAVPFIIELMFLPVGRVESDTMSIPMHADDTMLLKGGDFCFVNGADCIRVSGTNHAHRSNYSGTEGTNGLFRAVISDWTPIDRRLTISFGAWTEANGPCSSAKGPCSLN